MMVALMLLCALSGAHAQEPSQEDQERAKVLFAQGEALYDQGRYEEAVKALELAYELSGKPRLLFNLTAPLERLGRWEEALDAMERYAPDARPHEQEEVQRRLVQLRERVAEERAEAEALAAATQAGQKKGPPAGAWVLLGTGAVGVGTGTVFTARALGARGQWTSLCVGDPGVCSADAQPLVSRDRSSSAIADVSYAVGIAALAAGGIVALSSKKKRAEAADLVAVDLTLAVAPNGLSLGGSF
jgi:tetratricopeptide (TPR) repeat protein